MCEADNYFRELVRCIHLNPLRDKLAAALPALDRYPWCGHAAVLGRIPHPWQDRHAVLAWFGASERKAVHAYRGFVRERVALGRHPELVGGGLVRSAGGWAKVRARRRQEEPMAGEPRILGSGGFVEQLLRQTEADRAAAFRPPATPQAVEAVSRKACTQGRVSFEELTLGAAAGDSRLFALH